MQKKFQQIMGLAVDPKKEDQMTVTLLDELFQMKINSPKLQELTKNLL